MSFCDGNWYLAYYPDILASDTTRFEVLASKGAFSDLTPGSEQQCGCVNATSTNDSNSALYALELSFMTELTMILGLLFLAYLMIRSCSHIFLDWYRLILVYIIGTLAVPLTLALGPRCAGFNRVIGFGIVFHNLAEWFLVMRLWYGNHTLSKSSRASLFIVLYFWLILAVDTFLPLTPLFLILMIQGSFLDWSLVLTFIICGSKIQTKKNGSHFWWGFAAALTHILSIQPLFFEFSLSKSSLAAPTVILLVPTFILYIWWAASDSDHPIIFLSPSPTGLPSQMRQNNETLNQIEKELNIIVNKKEENKEQNNIVQQNETDEKDKKPISSISQVLSLGLMQIAGKPIFWIVISLAVLICIANSLIVFFAPCYVNVHKFVCGA